jgi:anti-sigma regulatory factor (Ser/Thr protein kinase)
MCTPEELGALYSLPASRLSAGVQAIADGRRFVRQRLLELRVQPAQVDVGTLLASEVLTNAVKYGPPPGSLRVHAFEDRVRVCVSDSTDTPPVPRENGENGGWGLHLLEVGALDWGYHREGEGKCIWYDIACDEPSPAPGENAGDPEA